jgi:hypothetical protein
MKFTFQQVGNQLTMRSESVNDVLLIGQLHAKLKSTGLHSPSTDTKELTVDVEEVLQLAVKK